MRPFRPLRDACPPAALPALLHATHLFGLALGSALGKLRDTGVTMSRMFEKAEEQALLSGCCVRLLGSSGRAGTRCLNAIARITCPSSAFGSSGLGASSACRNARRPRCFECRSRRSHGGMEAVAWHTSGYAEECH